ncbi:hypothetical protein HVA01_33320 [Halovibrio variabilis]|uniref:TOD1/MUCI70 glycosyltransferase-like domain-containing protein n=1 Tax=Halovibrio variabilis TaxID=31910 RepID=A0A511USW0_9GAMM|nr:glycosyltransferase domain-containing protein [Halovibrio variabilis]GEN29686.1 hypothetical protein HVA01_33320 [Halovibrio variabilis]
MNHKTKDNKNRFVVYTALFGDYDNLIDPSKNFKYCDFVCFTDQKNLRSNIWEIRLVEECDLPPNMMNRRYKFFPYLYLSEYEYSLYIDSNIKVKRSPYNFPDKYLVDHSVAIPKHFARTCIYEEAKVVIDFGKALESEVEMQLSSYEERGYPKDNGLLENNIILRRHNTKEVIELMQAWWEQIELFTARDQLSLKYVSWVLDVDINCKIPSARGNSFFTLKPHKQQSNRSTANNFKLFFHYNFPLIYSFLSKIKMSIF